MYIYIYIYIYIKKLFNTYGLNVSKISISKKKPYGKKKLIQILCWI